MREPSVSGQSDALDAGVSSGEDSDAGASSCADQAGEQREQGKAVAADGLVRDGEGTSRPGLARGRAVFGEPLLRTVIVALLLGVFSAALSLAVDKQAPMISPVDEWTHADYAWQVSHGTMPAAGSLISPEILNEWSCHGFHIRRIPACDSGAPASDYPARGENYNYGHVPLYYAVTGSLARLVTAVGVTHDFILAARLVGILWLWAGLAVLYAALRRLRCPWILAATACAVVAVTPAVLRASTMVTNDAPAVLSGAVGLWVLGRIFVKGRTGWLLPGLATVLMTACKQLNALPMLALAGVLVVVAAIRFARREPEKARALLAPLAAILVGFLIVYLGWKEFQSGRGVAGWVSPIAGQHTNTIKGSPIGPILSRMFSGFHVINAGDLGPGGAFVNEPWTRALQLFDLVFIAAPFMAMAAARKLSGTWVVGLATLVGLIGYSIAVEVEAYVSSHSYFPLITARYGITMIPLGVAALALVAGERKNVWLPLVGGLGACVIAMTAIFG